MRAIQELKKPIRDFMRAHYTDERLAQLLCHARDGKLSFHSCCCFIGISTSDHALRSASPDNVNSEPHIFAARRLAGAGSAESAFMEITDWRFAWPVRDEVRRRILIPMIRAEMKRREKLISAPHAEEKTIAELAPSLVAQG